VATTQGPTATQTVSTPEQASSAQGPGLPIQRVPVTAPTTTTAQVTDVVTTVENTVPNPATALPVQLPGVPTLPATVPQPPGVPALP